VLQLEAELRCSSSGLLSVSHASHSETKCMTQIDELHIDNISTEGGASGLCA
jgi:hypothetical protein